MIRKVVLTAGLILVVAALLAATAQGQERVDLGIDELGGSGVTGSAFVMPASGGQAEVTVSLIGLDSGSSHVNHIHDGTGCGSGEYTAIAETLTNVDADASGEGTATTTASIDFDTVTAGNHVIVVHAGATLEEGATPIACARIPVASTTSLPPAGTGFSSDSSTTGLAIALGSIATLGVALLAGGWMLRRRTAPQVS